MDRKDFLVKSLGLVMMSSLSLLGFAADQKESEKKFKVIPQRCDGCGHCFKACRDEALLVKDGKACIDGNKCKGCGDCLRFCRRMAIVEQENKK
jgi:ferredoxin